jgi:hypothetical protein
MEVTDNEKQTSGLYYKPMMIVNDNSRVVNKLEASLTDNTRVVIYDHHMFIVQATAWLYFICKLLALLANIRLEWKWFTVKNILDYDSVVAL